MFQGTKAITEWKKHILRTVNQDEARKIIIEGLKNDEAFLERDWAMKFLPLQYRYELLFKNIFLCHA